MLLYCIDEKILACKITNSENIILDKILKFDKNEL